MAAPSIADLLDYETHLEDAFAAYLAAQYTAWQVLTDRTSPEDEDKLRTPRAEVAFALTGTGSAEHQAQNRPDEKYYESHKTFSMTVRIAACRAKSDQSLGRMRGQAREAMLPRTLALSTVNLPYFEILDVSETGSSPAFFAGNDEIQSELTWSIHLFIPPASWPVS